MTPESPVNKMVPLTGDYGDSRGTISICAIFYLNSLNIQICVSQRSRESNGVGLRSHNYDVTNVCPDSIVCAWQPPAGLPTTLFEIKYVRQT